ncbi:MAG: alpha/beta fold hydrolase [Ectothiorhodospiraceae bacterium]|nr:alpha/beta fold hydrolase [Ectothiorhodospiraceae bacterium]
MWEKQVTRFQKDYQTIVWDLIGHGESEAPPEDTAYHVESCVRYMDETLSEAGAHEAVLIGFSLGGLLSLEYFLKHPLKVKALVLIGAGPGYATPASQREGNDMAEVYAREIERHGLRGLTSIPLLEGTGTESAGHKDHRGLVNVARHTLTREGFTIVRMLGSVAVPTLLIAGEHDTQLRRAAEFMHQRMTDSTLVVIPGAGHAATIDAPDACNEVIGEFLKKHEKLEG